MPMLGAALARGIHGWRIWAIWALVWASAISLTTSSSRGVSATAGPPAPSSIQRRMIDRSAALVRNASPRPTACTLGPISTKSAQADNQYCKLSTSVPTRGDVLEADSWV
jgi:hypothetical protein